MSLRYLKYRTSLANNVAVAEKDNNNNSSSSSSKLQQDENKSHDKNNDCLATTPTATVIKPDATTNGTTTERAAVVGDDDDNKNNHNYNNSGGSHNVGRTFAEEASGVTLLSTSTTDKSSRTMGDGLNGNMVGNVTKEEQPQHQQGADTTGEAIADPPLLTRNLEIPQPAFEGTNTSTNKRTATAAPRYQAYRAKLSKKVPHQNQSDAAEKVEPLPTSVSASDIAKTAATATKSSQQSPRYEAYRSVLAKSVGGGGGGAASTTASTVAENSSSATTTTTTPKKSTNTNENSNSGANPQSPRYLAYRSSLAKSVTPNERSNEKEAGKDIKTVGDRNGDNAKQEDASEGSFSARGGDANHYNSQTDKKENKAASSETDEDENLATRLTSFLSKAEKGKPSTLTDEIDDMHTSWSDFDAADLPDTESGASVGARKSRFQNESVTQEQEKLIEHVLATTAKMRSSQKRQEAAREGIQNERLKSYDEHAQDIVQEQRQEDAAADIENGMRTSEKKQDQEQVVEPTRRRMSRQQKTAFLIACIIVAVVLLVLGYVFR